jgi:hypothetical protein
MKGRIQTGLRIMTLSALMMVGMKPAVAWDGVSQGTVYALEVTGGANYGFRVFVSGVTNMCGNGSNWAYLNEADSNYKTYVAVIMMAKAQGSPVTIYTNVVNGYCHIGYVSVNS